MKTGFLSALLILPAGILLGQTPSAPQFAAVDTADAHRAVTDAPSAASRRLYIGSVLFAVGANALDIYSSYGKRELNPMLQGSNGTFSARSVLTKAGMVSGLEVPQILLVRHSARRMRLFAVANFAMSAALAGMSAHNFGVADPAHVSTPAAAAVFSSGLGRRR